MFGEAHSGEVRPAGSLAGLAEPAEETGGAVSAGLLRGPATTVRTYVTRYMPEGNVSGASPVSCVGMCSGCSARVSSMYSTAS